MNTTQKKNAHHHGDLRNALVNAGLALLEEEGLHAVTIRGVASRAQVSHAAPKHHFPNLTALHTTLAARGYQQFTETMKSALKRSKADPRERILAACGAYITFGFENPAMFHLMFGDKAKTFCDADLELHSAAAYAVLAEVASPIKHGSGGAEANERMIWSLVHGYTHLALAKDQDKTRLSTLIKEFRQLLPELDHTAPMVKPTS